MLMKKIFKFLLIFIILYGCQNSEEITHSYVGGEIINPINRKLTIFRSNKIIDSLELDNNNRFLTKIKSTESGFYGFYHGSEYQLILLEPNDSITLRVNTLDFDESLSFSGVGSKKNNYLINLFTKYENSRRKRGANLYRLNPTEFKNKIDSIKLNEVRLLKKFTSSNPNSQLFKKVAMNTINYIFNSKKEAYRFIEMNNNDEIIYPENFYDFRKKIDYNNGLLDGFYQYYNFLFPHFDNLAYEKFVESYNSKSFSKGNLDYNMIKLDLIDSLVQNIEIKSRLTSFITRRFLSFSKSKNETDKIYNHYLNINNNPNNKEGNRVTSLYNSLIKLQKGKKLPIIELVSTNKIPVNINNLITNKSVIYFWSKNSKNSYKYSHDKVKELKEAYPNINFISINIDKINSNQWLSKLKRNSNYCNCNNCKLKFPVDEYKLRNVDIAKKLLGIQYIRKTIIVDSKMNIIESNINLFSDDFNELIN